MVSTRTRKRAASPPPDSQPNTPKKTRNAQEAKSEPAQPISDDDGDAKQPAPKRKARGKAVKAEPQSDAEEGADDPNAMTQTKQSVKQKGKGKAKPEPEPEQTDETESSAQFAKGNNILIPMDERCNMFGYHVYVDSNSGIIYDAALNQTNAGNNNNKFYKIQLLTNSSGDFKTWTRWGRVGEGGQNALLGDGSLSDALRNFDSKFKGKSGLAWKDRNKPPKTNKYVFVEKSYEPDSEEDDERPARSDQKSGNRSRSVSPAKCTLEAPLKTLMELVFNVQYMNDQMADMNYDVAKLPLGKLSKNTITRGYQALKNLSALFNDPSLAQSEYETNYTAAMEQLSNQYYSYIPHAFGRNRPPVISDHGRLKKEVELLESLTDLKDTDAILKSDKSSGSTIHPLNARFNGLGMREMTAIKSESPEFTNIKEYLVNTRGATHGVNYDVQDIFRIEREGETDRFGKYSQVKSDRRLLWHGSRTTNFGGILSQGLRIAPPEAPVSGYMFGKGVYLADMSSKSANYCYPYISGGQGLLLLCEAELGDPMHELTGSSYTAGEDALKNGSYSTWGKGTTGPSNWKDAGCLHSSLAGVKMPDTTKSLPGPTDVENAYLAYNEFICYDVAQIRLRYLLRVAM